MPGQLNAFSSGLGKARPLVSITMCSGGARPIEQRLHGRQEVLGDGAAQAAIRQLDDVLLIAALDAAGAQHLAIDAERAELVDDDRDAPAARMRQQMPHQRGLAGAQETSDDRCGDLRAHSVSKAGKRPSTACGERGRALGRHHGAGARGGIGGAVGEQVRGERVGEAAQQIAPFAGRRDGGRAAALATRQALYRLHPHRRAPPSKPASASCRR